MRSNSTLNKLKSEEVVKIFQNKRTIAYTVKIKEGIFTVVNFNLKEPKGDYEVFWARYGHTLNPTTSEYKAAIKAVLSFMHSKDK